MLYTRNIKPYLGDQRVGEVGNKGLSGILTSNPLSSHFISPYKAPDSKRIYQYLISVQTGRYGKQIDLTEPIIRRHISLALENHTPVWIIRAIRYAGWISEYPFSIPFAVRALEDYEAKSGTSRHRTNKEASSVTQNSFLFRN